MNKELGYVRVGALIPELKVGNTIFNTKTINMLSNYYQNNNYC